MPAVFATASDSREVFLQWNDSDISNPRTLLVNGDLNLQARYMAQYRLVISTNFGTTEPPVGKYWINNGSTMDICAISPDVVSGESYNWSGWSQRGSSNLTIIENSTRVTLDGPLNVTANVIHMYYLKVTSEHGSPVPSEGWYEAGQVINESVTSPDSGADGTRYICTGWTGTGSPTASGTASGTTFTLYFPSSIQWLWKTQYSLTASTDPAGLAPTPIISPETSWCDEQTVVTCTAQQVNGYVFQYWSAGSTTWDVGVNPINFTIDKPYEIVAHYDHAHAWWEVLVRPDVMQATLALVGTFLSVGLLGGAWLRSRRRRNTLKNFLVEVDNVYFKFKSQRQKCEEELLKLRNTILEDVTEGKITESNYEIIEKRIDKHMKELLKVDDKKKTRSDAHTDKK
jgi:hypothetical protein